MNIETFSKKMRNASAIATVKGVALSALAVAIPTVSAKIIKDNLTEENQKEMAALAGTIAVADGFVVKAAFNKFRQANMIRNLDFMTAVIPCSVEFPVNDAPENCADHCYDEAEAETAGCCGKCSSANK